MSLPQYHPTLARGKFKQELMNDPNWWAETKFDGDRRIGIFTNEGVRFTGRRISEVDGLLVEKTDRLPHLAKRGCWRGLIGTVLDGEIIFPGGRSKDVTSIIGSLPSLAIEKQELRGWLRWAVFDCLFYKGEDVRRRPYAERRMLVYDALNEWGNEHAFTENPVSLGKDAFLARILEEDGEGIVLKYIKSVYSDEKKWVKYKRQFTEDVVVMGYDSPKATSTKVSGETSVTKYAARGWIGAVRFGQYQNGNLLYCGSCSGFPDDVRQAISEDSNSYVGRVMEILANEREPTGKFRHPRFLRWRDDKNPRDCVWDVR